jgi:hydroxyacylglutathione hydrolase
VHLQALPAFEDNYIWVLADGDRRALIVDPGDAGPVLAAADRGLIPAGVLLTHHHHDHIGGTARLLERWPELPVVAPHDDRIAMATRRVGDGDRVDLEGWHFQVIAVPGHTLTHIAFYAATPPGTDGGAGLLFCGDTLFSLGCGRMFEGSAPQMAASLALLAALPGDTRVCCGHEYTLANAAFARVVDPDNPALRRRTEEAKAMRESGSPTLPSTIASEVACNPFLRCGQTAVQAAVSARLGRPPADAVETFAELRRWKDGFRA